MKKIILLLTFILIAACTTEQSISNPDEPNQDLINSVGDYTGFANFQELNSGRVHTGLVFVKIENIDGSFFVTSLNPDYLLDETGQGSGTQVSIDTTFVYSEKDTSGIREIIDTTYRIITKTERVQVVNDSVEWSEVSQILYIDEVDDVTELNVEGYGKFPKVQK